MNEQVDFKAIERRTRQVFYQDGLLDIMIGVYVYLVGLLSQNGISPSISVLLMFAMLWAMRVAKQRFVFPRIGYIKLPEDQQQAKKDVRGIVRIVGGGLLALAAIAWAFSVLWGAELGREYLYFRFIPVFISAIFAVALIALARQNSVGRWYLLAGWFLLVGFLMPQLPTTSFDEALGLQLIASSILPLVFGVVVFIRFLRSHPVIVAAEVSGESEAE